MKKNNINIIIVDTTIISNKYGRQSIARNKLFKNKNCSKISALSDKNGVPLSLLFSDGRKHDLRFVRTHIRDIKGHIGESVLLGDRGYVSKRLKEELRSYQIQLMVMKKRNMKDFGLFDKNIYKQRIFIEHLFQRLKCYRRLQTRYEASIMNFKSFTFLASCILIHQHIKNSLLAKADKSGKNKNMQK